MLRNQRRLIGKLLKMRWLVRRVGIEPTTYGLRVLKRAIPMTRDELLLFVMVLIVPHVTGDLLRCPTATVCHGFRRRVGTK
jgi:hypothetical protein